MSTLVRAGWCLATALTLILLGLTTTPADAGARYAVSIRMSHQNPRSDAADRVTIAGYVSPNARYRQVLVQVQRGSGWTTVATPRLNRYSKYVWSFVANRPGDAWYRVVKPRSPGHAAGVSEVKRLTTWRYRPLLDLPFVSSTGTNAAVFDALIGGPEGPYGLRQSGAPAEYAVDAAGKCISVSGRATGLDTSATTDPMTVRFSTSVSASPDSYSVADEGTTAKSGSTAVLNAQGWLAHVKVSSLTGSSDTVDWNDLRIFCKS